MASNFKLVSGVHVSDLDGIYEGYCVSERQNYSVITINVSAENIDVVFRSLCKKVRTPGFLFLEHGTHRDIEDELRKNGTDSLHKDIFYLGGLQYDGFLNLYEKYKDLLVNDGMIRFGFSSQSEHDEVFVSKYKIFTIFADDPHKYTAELERLGICKNDNLKTVWENFTSEAPGECHLIRIDDRNIYDMVEELKELGLYFAERREED